MLRDENHAEINLANEITIPAIRIRKALVVTLPADLGFGGMDAVISKIRGSLQQQPAKTLILECSGLQYMDLTEFSKLKYIADMASLQGMVTYMVGLNPGIAAYLAVKDADLSSIFPRQNLEDVLDNLDDVR